MLLFYTVVIYEAAVQDDLAFFFGEVAEGEGEGGEAFGGHGVGGDGVLGFFYGFSDAGDEEVVFVGKGKGAFFNEEGEHSPVNQVGAVAFGGVFGGYVGPAAQDLLATGCLFPGGSVTGFYCKNGGSEADVSFACFREAGVDGFHDGLQLGLGLQGAFSFHYGGLCGLDVFCQAYVGGVFAGEREFRKAQGVGAVG